LQAAEARAAAEREAEAKAAAMREAEARLAAEAAAKATAAPPMPEVLVLGGMGATIQAVCRQLEGFGFQVRQLGEPPQLPAPWPFAAVFVDRALQMNGGGDAIDLCNHVRESSRLPGERKPVLMLVAEQLSATDKVRAGLAGCNELIVGEITRGAVAGALDRRGIVLPSDARRVCAPPGPGQPGPPPEGVQVARRSRIHLRGRRLGQPPLSAITMPTSSPGFSG
jgi:CheY-like chemotaxis protein